MPRDVTPDDITGLRVTNIRKSYRKRPVIRDVSMHLGRGEVVALLGPNGSGKTTCFYLIAGLIPLEGGQVTVDGEDVTTMPMYRRANRGIGYLPQEASIFRKLTVYQNLMAILQTRKELSTEQQELQADALLDEFNINHIRNSLGMSLSGGERRRVEIARALAAEPKFILLDEPFAGVDPISVNDIKIIIQHLRDRGIGVLITDHNVRETLDVCEKAYIVSHGELIASGTAEQVLSDQRVRDVYLGEQFRL